MTEKETQEDIEKNCKTLTNFCEMLVKGTDEFLRAVKDVQDKNGNDEKFYHLITSIVFIKYSIRDIFLLYKIFYASKDLSEKNVLARTMATHVAGFIKDMDKIQGLPLAQLIKPLKDEELTQLLTNIRNIHKLIKLKYEEMKTIRNAASAHKDRDIIKQIQVMNSIDYDEWMPVIAQFQLFTLALVLFDQAITNKRREKSEGKGK